MIDFDPEGFGRRVQAEMEGHMSITALQKAVRAKLGEKAPGTSYGTIYSYVKGQAGAAPREEVVGAIAEEFGVLPHWLRSGMGPRTKEERRARREELGEEIWSTYQASTLHPFLEEVGLDPHLAYGVGLRMGLLSLEDLDVPGVEVHELFAAGWEGLAEVLLGTLHSLTSRPEPTPGTRRLWRSYLRAMLLATEQAIELRNADLSWGSRVADGSLLAAALRDPEAWDALIRAEQRTAFRLVMLGRTREAVEAPATIRAEFLRQVLSREEERLAATRSTAADSGRPSDGGHEASTTDPEAQDVGE